MIWCIENEIKNENENITAVTQILLQNIITVQSELKRVYLLNWFYFMFINW